MHKCEICRGERVIRLPVFATSVTAFNPTDPMPASVPNPYREYPCPECSDKVNFERVQVLDAQLYVDPLMETSPETAKYVREAAAHNLIAHLLKGDHIKFERGPIDAAERRYPMVATLGVIPIAGVAKLEDRIRARQGRVAEVVAQEAKRQIWNWGSYYGDNGLRKDDAIRFIDEALRRVLANWSKIDEIKETG